MTSALVEARGRPEAGHQVCSLRALSSTPPYASSITTCLEVILAVAYGSTTSV